MRYTAKLTRPEVEATTEPKKPKQTFSSDRKVCQNWAETVLASEPEGSVVKIYENTEVLVQEMRA